MRVEVSSYLIESKGLRLKHIQSNKPGLATELAAGTQLIQLIPNFWMPDDFRQGWHH